MKTFRFSAVAALTLLTAGVALGQNTKTTTTATTQTRMDKAPAKQISEQDQKAIKSIIGDKYDVSFASGSAVISEKNTKMSQVKVGNGRMGSPGSAVGIITVDVVINKNNKPGIDNLSARLDKQSMQRLQTIMTKYQ